MLEVRLRDEEYEDSPGGVYYDCEVGNALEGNARSLDLGEILGTANVHRLGFLAGNATPRLHGDAEEFV